MAILVTGGAGYIGSHTCVELLSGGYDIVVADNFSNSNPEALRRVAELTGKLFTIVQADLQDRQQVEELFKDNKIEAVIHFAALKAVGESVDLPLKYYQNNIAGTLILLETMERFHVKKIVFSSSATVYGEASGAPITENEPIGAANPYGRTKQVTEEILMDLHKADQEWSIAILRYFNPIGAHESGMIGEDPNGIPNNLVPYISQVAIGKRDRLRIHGKDYPTKDGTGVRDYIHVVDLAKGHIKALEKIKKENVVDTFNLGTGKGYSVLEVVKAFQLASGRMIPCEAGDRRPGDIAICYADPSKAQKELGWTATKTITEMCKDTWRWQQQNPNGYSSDKKAAEKEPTGA
ncbi:UDP-glucose 4-epimerase GalE [Jeotgalibacillus proteolyticus]|uniref:UDP-glucose 4-epimerase n=1 Tax=Jeotgalibacillus proteolyticus TaxID=2082395 RepID=A0A2S5G8D2_9BACL|nr:UDP-glucose 4-epimerase GalE [Jeotgalibacillus proteolyticus]PPA69238.1 UDP-glucose 4-epimerase GalE [Jeotgalibacillus proteolyticus]